MNINAAFLGCNPKAQSFTQEFICESEINFSSYISDSEDSINNLRIILKSLPTNGILTNIFISSDAVIDQPYLPNALQYRSNDCTQDSSDLFTYTAVDSNGLQSDTATVNLNISKFNTAPAAESFTTEEFVCELVIDFVPHINDVEDNDQLRVMLKLLPDDGTIINTKTNNDVIINQAYPPNTLQYKANNCIEDDMDMLKHVAVDSDNAESDIATVFFKQKSMERGNVAPQRYHFNYVIVNQ